MSGPWARATGVAANSVSADRSQASGRTSRIISSLPSGAGLDRRTGELRGVVADHEPRGLVGDELVEAVGDAGVVVEGVGGDREAVGLVQDLAQRRAAPAAEAPAVVERRV